jgi:hypothetical protein
MHAIPLIRELVPRTGSVSFARMLKPWGYSLTCSPAIKREPDRLSAVTGIDGDSQVPVRQRRTGTTAGSVHRWFPAVVTESQISVLIRPKIWWAQLGSNQ